MLRGSFSIKALANEFYPFREEKYFHNDLHSESYKKERKNSYLAISHKVSRGWCLTFTSGKIYIAVKKTHKENLRNKKPKSV